MEEVSGARMRWRPALLVDGALLLVFGAVFAGSFLYPPDARLFPLMVSGAGLALVLVMTLAGERSSGHGTHSDVDPVPRERLPRLALAVLSAPAFCLLVWLIGFYLASIATLILLPFLLGYHRWLIIVPVAAAILVSLMLVFSYAMDMSLPEGLLGRWFLASFVNDR